MVAEAAVVGFPHDIKGQGVYAYVVLQPGQEPSAERFRLHRGRPQESGTHPMNTVWGLAPVGPNRRWLNSVCSGE